MFLIWKKVHQFSYYYNIENNTWYGIKNNATIFDTIKDAASIINIKPNLKYALIIAYED